MKKKNRYNFAIKIFLPAILTVVLFIISFFWVVIPSFERNMMDGKRETIYELTQTACSILDKYNKEVVLGRISLEEAQNLAADEIGLLRYGAENKDYFWITDMHPNMIRHPYRIDLNGKDLTKFKDPHGKTIFVEFVNTVNQNGEGYVDYMWQWKDDSTRIVPKLSYVRSFKPWGWIIGTGIYIEDVKTEIAQLEKRLIIISSIITGLIIILLTFVMRLSLKADSSRIQAEKELKESRDRYKALVEASTEGTVMLLDSYVYANKTFLSMTGLSEDELNFGHVFEFLRLDRLFGCDRENFSRCASIFTTPRKAETTLLVANGERIPVILNGSVAALMGREAVIINVRHIPGVPIYQGESSLQIFSDLGMASFVSTFSRKSRFISFSPSLVKLIGVNSPDDLMSSNIADLFADPIEKQHFLKTLLSERHITDYFISVLRPDHSVFPATISAALHQNEGTDETLCTGVIAPASHLFNRIKEIEALLSERLAPDIYLQQPLKNFARAPLWCRLSDSVAHASHKMISEDTDILAVKTAEGDFAGLITLKSVLKLLTEGYDPATTPTFRIMEAPLPVLASTTSLSDALGISEKTGKQVFFLSESDASLKTYVNLKFLPLSQALFPQMLLQNIDSAMSINNMADLYIKYRSLVATLLKNGLTPERATEMLSSFSKRVIARLNTMAIAELGAPPVAYTYLILGSVGRGEQTFATDQDNAIIFANTNSDNHEFVKRYFLELGTLVSDWLSRIGYDHCRGQMMASNPRWCVSLNDWKKYFREWLSNSEPRNLLEISVFFDFVPAFGNTEMAEELRNYIIAESKNKGAFYFNLAQSIMQFKPPLNLLGNIVSETTGNQDGLDIKNAISQMVMMMRLYSIYHGRIESNTLERLEGLRYSGVFNPAFSVEFAINYNYLMLLRFKHQISNIEAGESPGNMINPRKLSDYDRTQLKRVFSFFSGYQSKIGYDFTGNMG